MKEYKEFRVFYNDGFNLAQKIKALTPGMSALQRVVYARGCINKEY